MGVCQEGRGAHGRNHKAGWRHIRGLEEASEGDCSQGAARHIFTNVSYRGRQHYGGLKITVSVHVDSQAYICTTGV